MTDCTVLIECFVAEVYNRGNLAAIKALCAPTTLHNGHVATIEEFGDAIRCLRQLFPDLRVTLDAFTEAGELVWVHWSVRHRAATGPATQHRDRQGGRTELRLFRIVDGRIVEVWYNWTAIGQLEARGMLHLAKLPAGFTVNVTDVPRDRSN